MNNNLITIGITGSKGKTTVAYLIYSYLKKLGLKAKLYSSIDYEVSISNNDRLIEIIEKSKKEEIKYLILEINEEYINDIDNNLFNIKILTNVSNINYKGEEDEYLNLIESFFLNSISKNIITYSPYVNWNKFNTFLNKLDNKILIGSSYVVNKYNLDANLFNYLVYSSDKHDVNNINGMSFLIKEKDSNIKVKTNLIFTYNSINILIFYACIKELGLYDEKLFLDLLKDIKIPGRSELIKYNNRYIIISPTLSPELELLHVLKDNNNIKRIILVTASIGVGHNTWEDDFNSKEQIELLHKSRKFACTYASKYSDLIYLTSSDPASTNPQDIANEMESNLIDNNFYNTFIEVDRFSAINNAISNSKQGDAILISGRGSRNKYIINNKELYFSDEEIVNSIIKKVK